MKHLLNLFLIAVTMAIIASCGNGANKQSNAINEPDTLVSEVPDTGFTGIKQYFSAEKLVKEVTFDNGIKQGIMKTFYGDGRVRQTFMYRNGVREDTARWLYEEGQVFRETLYKNDTMNGDQTQYYKTGKVKARMSYINGARTPELIEYASNGTEITKYPELIYTIKDDYRTNGSYKINLELSEKNVKVRFFRGEFTNGVFDSLRVKEIGVKSGVGSLELKKSGETTSGEVGIIASFLTGFGNRKFIYKSIALPYNDLK